MASLDHIVVVGASAAGLAAADTLRLEGFDGRLTLVGDELWLPYDRTPLSRHVLAGTCAPHRTSLRPEADLQRLRLSLRLGCRATGLDPVARTVALPDGERLRYDGLLIATGLRPRRLPFGHDLAGVQVLRTLDDALALRAELLTGPRVVVVGAGLLGTEIAATARGLGLDVTLVDARTAPLERHLGGFVGALVADLHRGHGVRLRLGRRLTGVAGARGRVTGVVLDDGSRLDAEVVVVAIGSVPATDWLAGSGIPLGDGVLCDPTCRVTPRIGAAGDVASWPHPFTGGRIRLELRTNATLQAITAARNLLAGPAGATAYAPVPFGWTDQYDTRIQFHGWSPAGATVEVVDGAVRARSFVALHRAGGRVVGAVGWNSPRALLRYVSRIDLPAAVRDASGSVR
ncbi:FAD-dependent oxidoreductase [Streptomyces sp. NPDC020742]|uniref:NAD(P)/FAD-dependent oxidoreductase n=1 Tax=Streptomyces sp. NPDC020742 TaxID=3154897 RepID=UPI0033CAB3E0